MRTTRRWERTTDAGDTVTVVLDDLGAAVSIRRISGAHEGYVLSHEAFAREWLPWIAGPMADAADEVAEALEAHRQAAEDLDDREP